MKVLLNINENVFSPRSTGFLARASQSNSSFVARGLGSPLYGVAKYYCLYLFFFAAFICSTGSAQRADGITLQPGDLLFQDIDCGSYCDAIEKVTFGYRGAKFSHMGMVVQPENKGKLYVIEAIAKGVVLTPLDSYLQRSADAKGNPKVIVGRLKPEFRPLAGKVVKEALALLGKPYDAVYDIEDDTYYCSEMIYEAFKRANGAAPFFLAAPMTFIDPDTHQTFPVWETYFANLGVPIPEGRPGINPGLMSRSDKLDIVHVYGMPEGWE